MITIPPGIEMGAQIRLVSSSGLIFYLVFAYESLEVDDFWPHQLAARGDPVSVSERQLIPTWASDFMDISPRVTRRGYEFAHFLSGAAFSCDGLRTPVYIKTIMQPRYFMLCFIHPISFSILRYSLLKNK